MNGRVYDPFLARFLSPDPFVQAPGYGQNYNRYSYAFNNPLKYTDPDGEFAHLIIGGIFGGFSNLMMNADNIGSIWQGIGYFGVGAAAGALSAGIGAGVGGLMSGAGSFSFSVASSLSVGGILPGMAIGASAGFTNGFITGTGNSLIAGNKLGSALGNGINKGIIQGGTGALFGGIAGGIRAHSYGGDLWTGKRNVPILTGKLPFNGNVQIAAPEVSINSTFSEIKTLRYRTGYELHFDGNSLDWQVNYSDESYEIVKSYRAVSGYCDGINALPSRTYTLSEMTRIGEQGGLSYYRDGIGFWGKLEPRNIGGRCCFGIHPDGNSLGYWWYNDGSAGCIVLQENSGRLLEFFNEAISIIDKCGSINVIVY